MKYRIAMWATVGCLIASSWAVLSLVIHVSQADPVLWNLAQWTCPIVFLGFYLHVGLRFYWVILANGATYALIGTMVEALRLMQHRYRTAA
jgi:hypothetical protein